MSYVKTFVRSGKKFYLSNLTTSEMSLVLSPSTLSDMTDEAILDTVLWFRENAQEIDLVMLAEECSFSQQFIDDSGLQKVIDSTFASPETIAQAKSEKYFRLNGRPPKGPRRQAKKKEGWVYLIQAGKYYKIGMSQNLPKRVGEILSNLPSASSLVCKIKTEDISGTEARLHEKYSEFRVKGEWFELPTSAVEEICLLSGETTA